MSTEGGAPSRETTNPSMLPPSIAAYYLSTPSKERKDKERQRRAKTLSGSSMNYSNAVLIPKELPYVGRKQLMEYYVEDCCAWLHAEEEARRKMVESLRLLKYTHLLSVYSFRQYLKFEKNFISSISDIDSERKKRLRLFVISHYLDQDMYFLKHTLRKLVNGTFINKITTNDFNISTLFFIESLCNPRYQVMSETHMNIGLLALIGTNSHDYIGVFLFIQACVLLTGVIKELGPAFEELLFLGLLILFAILLSIMMWFMISYVAPQQIMLYDLFRNQRQQICFMLFMALLFSIVFSTMFAMVADFPVTSKTGLRLSGVPMSVFICLCYLGASILLFMVNFFLMSTFVNAHSIWNENSCIRINFLSVHIFRRLFCALNLSVELLKLFFILVMSFPLLLIKLLHSWLSWCMLQQALNPLEILALYIMEVSNCFFLLAHYCLAGCILTKPMIEFHRSYCMVELKELDEGKYVVLSLCRPLNIMTALFKFKRPKSQKNHSRPSLGSQVKTNSATMDNTSEDNTELNEVETTTATSVAITDVVDDTTASSAGAGASTDKNQIPNSSQTTCDGDSIEEPLFLDMEGFEALKKEFDLLLLTNRRMNKTVSLEDLDTFHRFKSYCWGGNQGNSCEHDAVTDAIYLKNVAVYNRLRAESKALEAQDAQLAVQTILDKIGVDIGVTSEEEYNRKVNKHSTDKSTEINDDGSFSELPAAGIGGMTSDSLDEVELGNRESLWM